MIIKRTDGYYKRERSVNGSSDIKANNIEEELYTISVVINYFGNLSSLKQTVNSIKNQTIGENDVQIFIVTKNNCHIKETEISNLDHNQISLSDDITKIFSNISSPYCVFVNSGDVFSESYFKNAVLMFSTQKNIGWVFCGNNQEDFLYGHTKMPIFSLRSQIAQTQSPSIFRFDLLKKSLVLSNKFNKKLIFEPEVKLKVLGLGYYGQKDCSSRYMQDNFNIELNESDNDILLRNLILYRENFLNILKFIRPKVKFNKNIVLEGRTFKNENYYSLKKIIGKLISRLFGIKINSFSPKIIFYFLTKIDSFKREITDKNNLFTKAEFIIFREKPNINYLSIPKKVDLSDSVMFAHTFWNEGGGERVLKEWINSASKSNRFSKIIDIVESSEGVNSLLREEFRKITDEQYVLHDLFSTNYERLSVCWELIIHERPKIIFIMSNSFFYILTPVIKKYFPDIKIIDLLHNEYFLDSGWFGISSDYKKYIDKRIVISEYWKNVLIKKHNERPNKVIVANNFVDLQRFDPEKFDSLKIKKENRVSLDKRIIAFIGRINKQKNLELFLKLAEAMANDNRFEFIFVGSGDESDEYINNIKNKMKSLKNLKNFGHKTNIEQYLKITDVLIIPSYFEGYPLISLEAAAMNVPIIGSDIVGLREQVTEGNFGILYKNMGNEKDYLKIKDMLINDYEKLKKIATNGRSFVIKKHSLENQKSKYRNFIENL
jgi:glycosyltransferase involved in cell wall biosynthesis